MNRADRRKLQKQGVKVKPEPVINIKTSDVQNIKKEATTEAIDKAFLLMLGLPMLVLHDNYGFGKKRCERFIDQVLEMYDAFNKDYLTLDDIHKCLWEEAGVKIERK